jgi:hypothetical protein
MAKVRYLGLRVTDRNNVHKTTEYVFIIEYFAFLSPVKHTQIKLQEMKMPLLSSIGEQFGPCREGRNRGGE